MQSKKRLYIYNLYISLFLMLYIIYISFILISCFHQEFLS